MSVKTEKSKQTSQKNSARYERDTVVACKHIGSEKRLLKYIMGTSQQSEHLAP